MNTYPYPVWLCSAPPVTTVRWTAEDWLRYAGPAPADYHGGTYDSGAWRWYTYSKTRQATIDWLASEFPQVFNQEF